ncbi:RNA helicase, partial [Caulobacter sp. D4A]
DNRRNEDLRGQRRGEEAPRFEADNDLATTSDFRPAKKQFGPQNGMKNGEGRPARNDHRKGNGAAGAHAAHGAHEPGAQRKAHNGGQARPANGDNRGPVKFGNDNRNGGQQGRKRRPA